MRKEVILKREDGKQVRIVVSLNTHGTGWYADIFHRDKGKKKWLNAFNRDNWDYRKLVSFSKEREDYIRSKHLEHCTVEEIESVMRELVSEIPIKY